VPITEPAMVSSSARGPARATPKSTSLGRSSAPPGSITLPGFTSRCTTPAACAPASPRAIPSAQAAASSTESVLLATRSRSDGPSIHSITRYAPAGSAERPCATYRTIPGCDRRASTAISRSKRASTASSAPATIFTATGSPVTRSAPRYTVAMPPWPIG
jgi:hypothetical protein